MMGIKRLLVGGGRQGEGRGAQSGSGKRGRMVVVAAEVNGTQVQGVQNRQFRDIAIIPDGTRFGNQLQ